MLHACYVTSFHIKNPAQETLLFDIIVSQTPQSMCACTHITCPLILGHVLAGN